MKIDRRGFVVASVASMAGLLVQDDGARAETVGPRGQAFRICFFTDAHLPYANTLARLTDDKYHHQRRTRAAFDRANSFRPDAYVFGGDNVFAVDQSGDGGDKEDNARAQFDNWKKVVAETVRVPHHSVIGNHDIWHARPQGMDAKDLAIQAYGMPQRFYSWSMKGWKFLMLDVFGISGAPLDKAQMAWLESELSAGNQPICVVTHAPILSVTAQLVGGAVAGAKILRELFFRHPNVRLALSGHNHMLDCCVIDRVSYLCGGAVSGAWWEGDYEHFPPAFTIIDLHADGSFGHEVVFYEKAAE